MSLHIEVLSEQAARWIHADHKSQCYYLETCVLYFFFFCKEAAEQECWKEGCQQSNSLLTASRPANNQLPKSHFAT